MKAYTASLSAVLFLLIFVCSGLACAESIDNLRRALRSDSTATICNAAREIGDLKDIESVPLLAELTENADPEIRWCAVQSLSFYGDIGFCQDFYTIWLADKDLSVRQAAGMSLIAIDCDAHIERNAKFAMDAKSCGYTQYFINTVRDAIAASTPEKDWRDALKNLNIKETIVDIDTPEEIIQMRLNLVFSVMDWGETVAAIHSFADSGSLYDNKMNNLEAIERYTLKEEYIKQFCPIIGFPAFSYWNTVIEGKAEGKPEK